MPNIEQAFGDALRRTRRERKLSQEELAQQAGLDRSYVSLLERGLKSPTLRTLLKVAQVLQVPPSAIIRRVEQGFTRKAPRG